MLQRNKVLSNVLSCVLGLNMKCCGAAREWNDNDGHYQKK